MLPAVCLESFWCNNKIFSLLLYVSFMFKAQLEDVHRRCIYLYYS